MHIDDEVIARTAKASVAFGRLREKVLERNEIRLDTKLKVYKASVLPTLLYILREINLAISDKAGCISDLLTEWKII